MTLWNKTSQVPQNLKGAEKRNVVVTDKGYVRIKKYTDSQGNARNKEEILVAAGPGWANSSNWGTAKITDMWHMTGTITHASTVVNTWVSFSEPISSTGLAGRLKITVANTAGGNNMIASTGTPTVYDGNKILFRWKPGVAGTYKVQAQTAANGSSTAANTRSTNSGTELVSWVISGIASNNAGTLTVA